MATVKEKLKYAFKFRVIFKRWSFSVPPLFYIVFYCAIWLLSVPLRSNITIKIPNHAEYVINKRSLEDSFEIRMKNSNFNSDLKGNRDAVLSEKNEYLVNVNNNENYNKNENEILEEVFRK